MPQEGFLDQYHERASEISFNRPSERPAVPGGVIKKGSTNESSLDLSVNMTERSKKKPSIRYDQFDYSQDPEPADDSEEFKSRL